MKFKLELYFIKDQSHMLAYLNNKNDIYRVFIPKDCYKIILKKDAVQPKDLKPGQPLKQNVVQTFYIGKKVTFSAARKMPAVCGNFTENQIKQIEKNNQQFVLLADGVSLAIANEDSKLIDPNIINRGYISSNIDIYRSNYVKQ